MKVFSEVNHELKMYRIALFFGAILYPLFGYIYCDYYFHFGFDGFWERLWIGAISGMFLAISYSKRVSIILIRLFVLAVSLLVTVQYFYFATIAEYHWMYITGLIQVPVICIVVFYRKIDAIIYFIIILIFSSILFKEGPFTGVTYPFLISTYMLIYYTYFSNRENLMSDLKNKIILIQNQKSQIEEKNLSLIKIGELAAQVAHDIRSPVTALEAVSQVLGDEIDSRKKKLIENAAKRINDIANNLVAEYRENLTKDLSAVQIDRSITLNSLIEDVIEEKKLSLDNRHKIIFKGPEIFSLPSNINPTEFQRVISNLINNAIEAFKEIGLIEVSLINNNGTIVVTIKDNGTGIAQEKLKYVFEKGISSKIQGAGLGLTHAKTYIESIGGKIELTSQLDVGTSVTLYIPVT